MTQHDEDPEFGPLKTVILAGGFGTRLAERTDEVPKPMVEVGGMPILWHILKHYAHFGHCDFLVACGYRAEVIKRFFLEYRERASDLVIDFVADRVDRLSEVAEPWRVALLDTGPETMTGGRIKRLTSHLDGRTFLLTYGDGVADVDLDALVDFHRSHGRLATVTTVRAPSLYGRPRFDGDRIVAFAEKPTDTEAWISGGFFVLEPDVLLWIEGDETSFETETMPRLAEAGELMAYRHAGFWQPMDTLRDVRLLNRMWAEPDVPWRVWR